MTSQSNRNLNANSFSVSKNKLRTATFLTLPLITLAGMMSTARADEPTPDQLMQGGEVVSGSITWQQDGTTMNMNQTSDLAFVKWQSLSTGSNTQTNIYQPNSSSTSVHQDLSPDLTYWYGGLWSNGNVMLLDRQGIIFGKDAKIDVHGLVASTGDINIDVLEAEGRIELSNFEEGSSVLNEGLISVAEGGLAALVAPTVTNSGIINAKLGRVELAAGTTQATVDLYGDGLVEFAVSDDAKRAVVNNSGIIDAEGGVVAMTVGAAEAVVDSVINMSGVATAKTVSIEGGVITLGGHIDATGDVGGDVTVTGTVVNVADGAVIDASGTNGGGTIHVGGEFQGGGDTPRAKVTYVDGGATLKADAIDNGNGGEIVVWSDNATGAYGLLTAKGGANGGNGGLVEVSSTGYYDFGATVDTTAANGETGMLLLDPLVVRIIGGNGDGHDNNGANGPGAFGGYTNMGDNPGGLLAYVTLTQDGANPYTIYESEIEGASVSSNITIQATRSIETQAGAGLDNNVTLASNRSLTIETRNNAGDGNGTINLSNLAFTTQGTGTMTITGSTGTGVSNITVGNLTSGTGAINVNTDNGSVTFNGTVNGGGAVNSDASTSISVNGNITGASIDLAAPTVNLEANLTGTLTGTASTVNVNSNGVANGEQINDGIGVAATAATVNVGAGTYEEQVVIGKALNLVGAGEASTVIQSPTNLATGYLTNKAIVYVHDTDNVNISNLTVDGLGRGNANYRFQGIGYYNAGGSVDDVTVQNITETPFNGNQHGNAIYGYVDGPTARILNVTDSTVSNFQKNGITLNGVGLSGTVSGNTVTGIGLTNITAQNGIQIGFGASATVSDNTISGIGYQPAAWSASSILVYDAGIVTISDNTITGTGYDLGVAAVGADSLTVSDNAITGSGYGVYVDSVDSASISGNTIANSDVDGIYIGDSADASVLNNIITASGDDGIEIEDTTGSISVTGNTVDGTTGGHESNGLAIANSDGVVVDGNTIKNTDWNNINIVSADGTQISNNTLQNSQSASGIGIWQGSNNTVIDGNSITGSQFGIWNQGGALDIINNTISGNANNGIYLTNTLDAEVKNNFISGNTGAAVRSEGGSTTVVTGNSITGAGTLIHNGDGATLNASGNYWGTTSESTIAGKMVGAVDFTPYLTLATDTSAAKGFQGDFSDLFVTTLGGQTQAGGRINESIDLLADGSLTGGNRIIHVMAGTYNESVLVDKSVNLRGWQADFAPDARNGILEATISPNSPGFHITANDVTVNGFAIIGASGADGYGVWIDGANNAVVKNNIINNSNVFGVYASGGTNADINNNSITGIGLNGAGIGLSAHTFADVTDNVINIGSTPGADGIWVVNGSNNTEIDGNTVNNAGRNAITLGNVSNSTVTGNTLTGAGADGVLLTGGSDNTIGGALDADGNTIQNNGGNGIYVTGTSNIAISRNIVNNTVWDNIAAVNSSNVTINNNEVSGTAAHAGIALNNVTGATITENKVDNAGYGLYASNNTTGYSAHGNSVTNITNFLVWNNGTPGVFDASNNWWGTTDQAVIDGKMAGAVDFSPYLGDGTDQSALRGFQGDFGNLYVTTLGAQTTGLIQEAVNAATVGGTVNLNAGTYTENVNLNKANLKMNGLAGSIVQYDAGNPGINGTTVGSIFTVTASGVDIDPIVFDGLNIALFGVSASNAGANGLVVDGNTFRNFVTGGVSVDNNTGGTTLVENNIFEGTSKRGVVIGNLSNDSTINIENNDFGLVGGNVINGVHISGALNGGNVNITDGNEIDATGVGILVSQAVTGTSLINITGNTVTADNDGIQFNATSNSLPLGGSEQEINIDGNTITGGVSGINFNGATSNIAHDIRVANNTIAGSGNDGIRFGGLFADATAWISGNTITAFQDAISFVSNVTNGVVNITDNVSLTGGEDGIDFEQSVTGANSVITITGNDAINANNGSGVKVGGAVTDATFVISGNNDGISAADHGIVFGGAVSGADIDIHDNIIAANTDNDAVGSGVWFGSTVGTSTVNIGDGNGSSNPSNFITVGGSGTNNDGIRFSGNVGDGAVVVIDGNRIGYTGTPGVQAPVVADAIGDDGISFGTVNGTADIDITDNHILSSGEGVNFGAVSGTANILVGGLDGVDFGTNYIDAGSNGVAFTGGVTGESLIEISYNEIEGDDDGVLFQATSNADLPAGTSQQEINIHNNVITGGDSGINFNGATSDVLHDVRIADNTITGQGNDGIRFGGLFSDATAWISGNVISAFQDGISFVSNVTNGVINITDNTSITGGEDGVHFEQAVTGANTVITVTGNTAISGNNGDGVKISGALTDGSVNISDNDAINATDNGIEFGGAVTNADIVIAANNDGITSNNHGIYFNAAVTGGSTVDIDDNLINADANNNGSGDGIRFNSTIGTATITIGDGDGLNVNSNASNIISGVDGIHFEGNVGTGAVIAIDGNRIGYDGLAANPTTGANSRVTDDGISFASVNGNANMDITDNWVRSNDDGIVFQNGVSGTANILIGGAGDKNTILANNGGNGNGVVFESTLSGEALVEISSNEIDADQDGVLFNGTTSNADLPGGTSQQEIFINANTITGGDNGIRFAQNVSEDLHDIRITGNTITGESEHGISFDGTIDDESQVWILNNVAITGYNDGIHVEGGVFDDALVEIVDNALIEGLHDDAIDFNGNISGDAVVRINGNDDIRADNTSGTNADNGIEFAGVSGNATVEILGNNHGIHANDHGIYFGGSISGNADIDIHDNIIGADEDNNGTGDGIHFADEISGNATINIGDGANAFQADASNIIRGGNDGIHFADHIFGNADIVIDGNRLGYFAWNVGGALTNDRLGDDGIQFAEDIYGNADVTITDNYVRADDDGVSFLDDIFGNAEVLIGGLFDGNTIDANDEGIEFEDTISGNSRIGITYNDIEADDNGILFQGDTSNADNSFPFVEDEILIANNSIEAGENGISFEGRASGFRHDIMIRDNTQIHGHGGDGIVHTGGIDDAELRILDNDDVYGSRDGIHVEGFFFNDALIRIAGNTDVDSGLGDGIEVTDNGFSSGETVEIVNNHIHWTGDNGIEVSNVDDVLIQNNNIHNTFGNGIDVDGGSSADILLNQLNNILGAVGINVDDNDFAEIRENTVSADWWAGTEIGINVDDSDGIWVDDNTVNAGTEAGIRVSDTDGSTISDNDVTDGNDFDDGNDNGIELIDSTNSFVTGNTAADRNVGIFVDPSDNIYVGFNTAHDNAVGIELLDTTNSTLENNIVYDNRTGIVLSGLTDNIIVHNNTIGQLGQGNGVGLHLSGNDIGAVSLTDNVFTHNGTGLLVNSGTVDLTDLANPNTFIAEAGAVNYGMVFAPDTILDPNGDNTHLVDDTFGNTIFSGFDVADGDFYIRLEDGAFYYGQDNPPFLLDATQVSFNGIVAGGAKFGIGSLTPEQLLAIEAMLYDVDDFGGRGQIFALPDLDEEDPDDLNAFRGPAGNFSLTIAALPNVPGGGTASLGAILNNLTPFAGGFRPTNIPANATPEDLAGLAPAAGGDAGVAPAAADLNAIDPATGGENANCWGDVANSVGAGIVNFNFVSGDMGALVAAEAACGG